MKYLKMLSLFTLVFLFTACVYESSNRFSDNNSDTNKNVEIKKDDLIGKWNQINSESSLKGTKIKIEFIQFNENDSAEIQVTDSLGTRKIKGDWKYGFNKKIGNCNVSVTLDSDIQVSFNLNDNHKYKMLLKLAKENNNIVMTAYKNRFEKTRKE